MGTFTVATVATGADAKLRDEVLDFYNDWFVAIQAHDRPWIDEHLADDFFDWLVPTGKAMTKHQFIEAEMQMDEMHPDLKSVVVAESGPWVNAFISVVLEEKFSSDEVQDEGYDFMRGTGVKGVIDEMFSEPTEVAMNTVFRKTADGLRMVHHMLIGPVR